MNQFLPERFDEIIHRLALGIEPIDAQRGRRLSYELQVGYDATLAGLRRPPIERHNSNLFALRYQPGVPDSTGRVDLRFFDQGDSTYRAEKDRRRIVPRRLRIPILTESDVEAQEQISRLDFRRRTRRPQFFPGAAYDFTGSSTCMRGRVVRAGAAMRWARVVARLAGSPVVVGRAHGDDRGEFLLLINAAVTSGSAWPDPLEITVSVFGPDPFPPVVAADVKARDPLWDLPLEALSAPGAAVDNVATGDQLPGEYTKSVTDTFTFKLGKCLYQEFEIT
ncbi:MAG TPA: hypothetical protein VFX97_10085 [Pyrinomonadaceae bacterium]|nr:hypothetical protein [Pyrinomonadaceae bacterium]